MDGIRSLAVSAHIGREVGTGPYAGLMQDTSALSVATLVHEQLEVLISSEVRGEGAEGVDLVEKNMQKVRKWARSDERRS